MNITSLTQKIKHLAIEVKIALAISVLVFTVIGIGVFTYSKLTNIVNQVTDVARPDLKLVYLEQLLNNLSNAEGGVKSYNLTRDTSYLPQYYQSVSTVDSILRNLHEGVDDTQIKAHTDSLSYLVSEKYQILEAILLLQNNERVTDELKRITKRIKQTLDQKNKELTVLRKRMEHENSKSKGLLGGLFKSKKKKKQEEAELKKISQSISSDAILKGIKEDIDHEVKTVKSEQIKKLKYIKYKEFDLLVLDKKVMAAIRNNINVLKDYETKKIVENARIASEKANELRRLNITFAILASLLILLVGLVVMQYFRKNTQYTNAILQAKNEAQTLAKTKESFLANMSHEIRTPMNAIAGFAEQLLQYGQLGNKQKGQVETIKKSSDHLLQIINDILDYSKLQANRLEIRQEPFSLAETVKEVATILAPQAAQKNIDFVLDIDSNLPDMVAGDAMRLKQILFNLTGNAIKFTSKGSVTIGVKKQTPLASESTRIAFMVSDTGVGIAEQSLSKIFNEFEQADAAIASTYGGTGLGLSISKKLIELQKGELTLSSKPGKGTTIRFSIPYGETSEVKAKTSTNRVAKLNLKHRKVLIADDELYNRELLKAILEKQDAELAFAANGAEAWDLLKNKRFDILLVDMRMPVMDGVELCKKVRQKEQQTHSGPVPIIALTAAATKEDVLTFTASGVDDYLLKPFRESELLMKMAELMNIPVSETHAVETAQTTSDLLDLRELKQLSAGDDTFYKDMIQIFIHSTKEGIQEMQQALQNNKTERVALWAHKIIPPCRHIGAGDLLTKLKAIEQTKTPTTAELNGLVTQAAQAAETVYARLEEELLA